MNVGHELVRERSILLDALCRILLHRCERPSLGARGHASTDESEGRQQLLTRHLERRLQFGSAEVLIRFEVGPFLLRVLPRELGKDPLSSGMARSLATVDDPASVPTVPLERTDTGGAQLIERGEASVQLCSAPAPARRLVRLRRSLRQLDIHFVKDVLFLDRFEEVRPRDWRAGRRSHCGRGRSRCD